VTLQTEFLIQEEEAEAVRVRVVQGSLLFAMLSLNKPGITHTYFSLFLRNIYIYISHTPPNVSSIAASVAYLSRVHAA